MIYLPQHSPIGFHQKKSQEHLRCLPDQFASPLHPLPPSSVRDRLAYLPRPAVTPFCLGQRMVHLDCLPFPLPPQAPPHLPRCHSPPDLPFSLPLHLHLLLPAFPQCCLLPASLHPPQVCHPQ